MPDDAVRELWCLVEGDAEVFVIEVPVDHYVFKLKRIIHRDGQMGILRNFDPKSLKLWKVSSS